MKQHIAIFLLLAFGLTGIVYPYFGGNVKGTVQSDFSTVTPIDYNVDLDHGLIIQVGNQLINKTNLSDFQFEFSALPSAKVTFGLFKDLAFRTWLKNDLIFFDVFQLLYPFHHFW
ncbi:hypothetical protein EF405_09820 [Cyclobacteriaceae bacterium YHN15]|nr:hypothetical protein EF405_09820 [Cyclobacteriaceae bacterium YHN15]